MGQQNSKSSLFIKIIQGQTQTHELFDFQNWGIEKDQKVIKSPSYLIAKGETVEYIQQQSLQQIRETIPQSAIYKITQDQFQQITIRDLSNAQNRLLWRIIKAGQCYPLKQNDMLKIGKIKIQLKRIVQKKQSSFVDQITEKDLQQEINHFDDLESVHSNHSNCERCRICFRSYNNKTDPLLCLCKCSGTIKFIHFGCLKDWISNSVSKRQDQHCKFYTYQETCCELCKHPLPNQFRHQGKNYSLFDFNTFQPPYAEFQYAEVENGKKKFYKYIINLQKDKQVLIGRNNSSQVVMKDISISRTHCSLEYKQGMLLLRDKKSKFGTLVKIDKSLQFNSQTGLQLQFDSKIIELYRKNAFKGCCCSDIDNYVLKFQVDQQRHGRVNSNPSQAINYNNPSQNQNIEIMRMDSNEDEQDENRDLINQGLQRDQNINSPSSMRNTMIRETIAQEGAIRY